MLRTICLLATSTSWTLKKTILNCEARCSFFLTATQVQRKDSSIRNSLRGVPQLRGWCTQRWSDTAGRAGSVWSANQHGAQGLESCIIPGLITRHLTFRKTIKIRRGVKPSGWGTYTCVHTTGEAEARRLVKPKSLRPNQISRPCFKTNKTKQHWKTQHSKRGKLRWVMLGHNWRLETVHRAFFTMKTTGLLPRRELGG